jgi:hypothetical protein
MNIECLICNAETVIEDGDPRICDECFSCPKCGATPKDNTFIIEEGGCVCNHCDRDWTFKAYERAMLKKYNRKMCPTCKGCGTVPA